VPDQPGLKLNGSCLCGGVSYEIDGPLTDVRHCHCSICRKAHSAAFRSRASVRAKNFRWIAGESLVTWYDTSPGTHRGFCSRCGSALLSRFDDYPDVYGLPLGCLDSDPGVRPAMHIYTGSKAPWFEITDALPQHEEGPPR
jgi:hypothetical protein